MSSCRNARAHFRRRQGDESEFIVDESNPNAIVSPTMRLQDYALLIATQLKGGKAASTQALVRVSRADAGRTGVKVEGRISATYRKRDKFYFTLEYESRDAATDQLLVRQAITSVLLNDKGEMR